MIKPYIVLALIAGCHWNTSAPLDANAACGSDQPGAAWGPEFDDGPTTLPVSADLTITGMLEPPAGITVSQLFVAGVAASPVGADLTTFTVTVPFGTVQSLAASAITPGSATLPVSAVTSCQSEPIPLKPLAVKVQVLTSLSIGPLEGTPPYIPTTASVSEELDLVANAEAVGEEITVTTTLGTVSGSSSTMVTLVGNGFGSATASVWLMAGASGGVAEVTAQGATAGSATLVYAAGPPQFTPPSGELAPDQQVTVSLVSTLPPPLLKASLMGCSATVDPDLSATVGSGSAGTVIQALTPLGADLDFTITAGSGSGSGTITVTCFDQFAQTSSATYTVN